ncbi:unnamed protein product [Polarella glacialis]|uniref:PPM-type phosphatase domain-containing protein n=1 Tax=Polarella glacialis TaxID=89957 RepID=A0A813JDB0_POLGL|nr:unnamed protein product [Polarella glacialis]CAE8674044.1 unnamed protein product [Polarella glacialis]
MEGAAPDEAKPSDASGKAPAIDVAKMSMAELKQCILKAGLSFTDCLEKPDLRRRAAEAVEKLEATAAKELQKPAQEEPGCPAGEAQPAAAARLRGFLADSAFMQGRRANQEDRHVKIPDLTKAAQALKMPIGHLEQPCAYFGVFDGHQGTLCSDFAAKNFHLKLLTKLSAEREGSAWTDERLGQTMREVCEELDAEFLAKQRTAPDGCTVVVALVAGERMTIAWLGDSRAILCRTTSKGDIAAVALTEDHRPSAPAEAERVRRAGGSVVNFDGCKRVAHLGFEERVRELKRARANGLGTIGKEPVALAVSRALGDRHFKAVTGKQLLVATPSVRCLRLNSSFRFIALMCDGITDVMRDEQVVKELDLVRDAKDAAANLRAACGALVQEAYKRKSQDNLTVIMAQFQWEGGRSGSTGSEKQNAAKVVSDAAEANASAAKRRRVDVGLAEKQQNDAAKAKSSDFSGTTFV